MSKMMVYEVPLGSCPCCGHTQFIVTEAQVTNYLTNRDGEIIDSKESYRNVKGICLSCKKEYEMLPTTYGFIPLTDVRRIVNLHPSDNIKVEQILNPMEG